MTAVSKRATSRGYLLAFERVTIAGFCIAALVASARAETINDALRDAFENSPVLKAERERLLATNQSIPAAQAGYLPNINAGANAGWQESRFAGAPDQALQRKPYGWSVTLTQPIFDGGATIAAVQRANENVRAGREFVALTESDLLLATASAYADVVQARAILVHQLDSLKALEALQRMTRERRGVGDVAASDLAQNDAAVAGAQIQAGMARSAVAGAESQFGQIVRRGPGKLTPFAASSIRLPGHLDTALDRADKQHPAIRAARHREAAARHAVDVATAKHLPTLSLQASYNSNRDYDGLPAPGDLRAGATIQAVARIPIYSGGSIEAEVQAARHTQISLVHELAQQRAAIRHAVTQAWVAWQQAGTQRKYLDQQIDANARVLSGVRKEQAVGQRTLADVLNAERDLLGARVALEQTKRQATVAAFALVASVGELTLQSATPDTPTPKASAATSPNIARASIEPTVSETVSKLPPRAGWTTTLDTASAVSAQRP